MRRGCAAGSARTAPRHSRSKAVRAAAGSLTAQALARSRKILRNAGLGAASGAAPAANGRDPRRPERHHSASVASHAAPRMPLTHGQYEPSRAVAAIGAAAAGSAAAGRAAAASVPGTTRTARGGSSATSHRCAVTFHHGSCTPASVTSPGV